MERDLRELLATIQNPHLRRLLSAVFAESWAGYREAPAAKRYHQAYRHGLLEHSLTRRPGGQRDLGDVSGHRPRRRGRRRAAPRHRQARGLRARRRRRSRCRTEGRLHGEIPLGYYRVRRAIERLDGFPPELAQAVLHIILSHHGSLEHGSPVVPCTREATLVHMIDNLGGRLGSFDRLEKELRAGEQWSAWDKALGGGAYFAPATTPSARPHRPSQLRDDAPQLRRKLRAATSRPGTPFGQAQLQLEWAWPRTPKS